MMGATFAHLYSYCFFLFWLPTYMVRARGFTEGEAKVHALPFLAGALANIVGGYARDAAVLRYGPKWGPRAVGMAGRVMTSPRPFAAPISWQKQTQPPRLALGLGGKKLPHPHPAATSVDIARPPPRAVRAW